MGTLAADQGQSFVIVKATEGMGGRNGSYAAQRDTAGAKFLGAYHFAWLNQDPAKEVENFLAYAALEPGGVAFLDVEDWGETNPDKPNYARDKAMRDATPWTQRLSFTLSWLDAVKAKRGSTPVLYANWGYIKGFRTAATQEQWDRLTSYPLWLADYSGVGGKHSTVTAKDGSNEDDWPIVLHQFTSTPVDKNYTPDLAALKGA